MKGKATSIRWIDLRLKEELEKVAKENYRTLNAEVMVAVKFYLAHREDIFRKATNTEEIEKKTKAETASTVDEAIDEVEYDDFGDMGGFSAD